MTPPCHYCSRPGEYLCDGPGPDPGRLKQGETCSRPLCRKCRINRGNGIACSRGRNGTGCRRYSIDWCPDCVRDFEAKYMTTTKTKPPADPPAETAPQQVADIVKTLELALARPFELTEVKWKPQTVSKEGNRALAIAFVDARTIQDRLDEVLGVLGWQDSYESFPDGAVVCRLKIRFGQEWIVKEDVGSPSEQPDEGDRRKAAFSDALKRAAVKFGIGRYLYRLPAQWVGYDAKSRKFVSDPQLPQWARPTASKVQARQSSPAKAPAKEPLPAPAPAEKKALPTGVDLLERLARKDAELAEQFICEGGELLRYLQSEAMRAKFPGDILRWGEPAIQLAIANVKGFEELSRKHPGAMLRDSLDQAGEEAREAVEATGANTGYPEDITQWSVSQAKVGRGWLRGYLARARAEVEA